MKEGHALTCVYVEYYLWFLRYVFHIFINFHFYWCFWDWSHTRWHFHSRLYVAFWGIALCTCSTIFMTSLLVDQSLHMNNLAISIRRWKFRLNGTHRVDSLEASRSWWIVYRFIVFSISHIFSLAWLSKVSCRLR